MNSLVKSLKLSNSALKTNAVLVTAIRNHWNKDYKPDPFVNTPEARAKAAEKYGLPLADYKPYKDDGDGFGDYPQLPMISADAKDPFYPYDNPELKRNFKEPLHMEFDLLREDRFNVNMQLRMPMWKYWAHFLGVLGGAYLIYHLFEKVKMFHPITPRQYPQEGKKHYTFEQN